MDNLTPEQRTATMRSVKSRNTSPELAVRRLCRELGYPGYRLHRKDIPGKPDIAYMGKRAAIFVHGCFWHGHSCTAGRKTPKTNRAYWLAKIKGNKRRDSANLRALDEADWRVLIVWECEMKNIAKLRTNIRRFLRRVWNQRAS